jgi:type VI secretion system protein ImpF
MGQSEKAAPSWDLPLFDRLVDEDRWIKFLEVRTTATSLQRLQLSLQELANVLAQRGLRLFERSPEDGARELAGSVQVSAFTLEDAAVLRFIADDDLRNPEQLRQVVIQTRGAPQGVALQSFCEIKWANQRNKDVRIGRGGAPQRRKLRESLKRDVELLLNTCNLQGVPGLHAHEHVQRSVLNYGIPAVTGSADDEGRPRWIAEEMRKALESFEPRLRGIRVMPEPPLDDTREQTLAFRIEAKLWDGTASVMMRTELTVNSGRVVIRDAGGA